MATVTVTNLTNSQVALSDFYITLEPFAQVSARRSYGEITAMFGIQALVSAGTLSLNIVFEPSEVSSEMLDPPPHAVEHELGGSDPINATLLSAGSAASGFVLETNGFGGFTLIPTPGAGPAAQGTIFSCPATVVLADVVYISSTDTVDKASAASGGGQTTDAVGVVIEKPTSTTCRVINTGLTPAIFSGLTIGQTYYVSTVTAGAIVSPGPSGAGEKVQEVGIAASSTKLFVDIDATSVVN